jgi:hypothetical protein
MRLGDAGPKFRGARDIGLFWVIRDPLPWNVSPAGVAHLKKTRSETLLCCIYGIQTLSPGIVVADTLQCEETDHTSRVHQRAVAVERVLIKYQSIARAAHNPIRTLPPP